MKKNYSEYKSWSHMKDRCLNPNNNGNYEPGNIRWATPKEQSSNTRRNRHVVVDGKKMIVMDAARYLNVSQPTIYNRINSGKQIEKSGRGKIVLDFNTGIYYDSAKEADIYKGISHKYMVCQLSGNVKNLTNCSYV